MGIEFMTGAVALNIISLIFAIAFLCVFYLFGRKLYIKLTNGDASINMTKETVALIGIAIFLILFSSASQPKLTLEPRPNAALEEYQREGNDVEFKEVEPRTEKLEGFAPLKEE